MMYHHDSRDYQVAASSAADRARAKFEAMIDRGRHRLGDMMGRLQREQPMDMVVPRTNMAFDANEIGDEERGYVYRPVVRVVNGDVQEFGLHSNAVRQVAEKVGVPVKYMRKLEDLHEPWAAELLAHNLNTLNSYADPDDRFLLRAVGGDVRGFLSDRYRRMDSGPILEAFADAAARFDAVPTDGFAGDTKWYLKMMLPHIFEPVPNEVMTHGVTLQNSDFGHGKLTLKVTSLRLWCTNYAIREESISQVHLGRRLTEDVEWSEKTHQLDTAAMASAVHDVVINALGPKAVNREMLLVKLASEEGIDAGRRLDSLTRRKLLSKTEAKEAAEMFNQADVEILPPGNTMWRFTNALSALAGVKREEGNEDRAVELEELSGKVMTEFERTKKSLLEDSDD